MHTSSASQIGMSLFWVTYCNHLLFTQRCMLQHTTPGPSVHTHTLHKQLWNLGTFRNFPRVLLTHPSESLCVHESCPASSSWAKEALNARGMLQGFGNARKSLGFSPVGCESCHSQRIKSTVRPHMCLSFTKSLPIWQVYVFKGRHLG